MAYAHVSFQDLINFVGSQENATQNFIIKLRSSNLTINSWDCQGDRVLQQAGVEQGVIDVEWNVERPESSLTKKYFSMICLVG